MAEYTPAGHERVANPKVSVCITTFNHERYIAQALESVLMQQTGFPFEIIVGEDDSADRTREIVTMFKDRFPNRLRVFLNDRRDVIHIDGRATGRWNFLNNLHHARGEYVALLDGDDFWSDTDKLAIQARELDEDPSASFCFHDVEIISPGVSDSGRRMVEVDSARDYDLEHIISNYFICTSSVLYRRESLGEIPAWFKIVPFADWPLLVLCAEQGHARYLPAVMGAYRLHAASQWSSLSEQARLKSKLSNALILEEKHFRGRSLALKRHISKLAGQLARRALDDRDYRSAARYLYLGLKSEPRNGLGTAAKGTRSLIGKVFARRQQSS